MSTDQKTVKTPDSFPISVLCDFITTYKGERETLAAFLTNCQNALELAVENQKKLLLKFMISKLQGKAQIACSNRVFESFEDLKTFLKLNFGERKHYNHLLLELQSCKQLQNESVSEFALRVENCLTDLQSEIHNSDSLKKDLPGRIAMTEDLALHTFSLGLKSFLSNFVRSQSPKNFNTAVNIAIEEEKIQNMHVKPAAPRPSKFCQICRRAGHSETECFSKVKKDFPKPNNNRPQFNTTSFPSSSKRPTSPITCSYCKNVGHHISQCRKREYNNARFSNSNNSRPNPSQERQQTHYCSCNAIPESDNVPADCDSHDYNLN